MSVDFSKIKKLGTGDCQTCGAKLKPLFSSLYCPNDCDKKAKDDDNYPVHILVKGANSWWQCLNCALVYTSDSVGWEACPMDQRKPHPGEHSLVWRGDFWSCQDCGTMDLSIACNRRGAATTFYTRHPGPRTKGI